LLAPQPILALPLGGRPVLGHAAPLPLVQKENGANREDDAATGYCVPSGEAF
jgi:hypothetical protein